FTLTIDGKKMNDEPASNVRATDLKGDFFRIGVQFQDKALGQVNQGFALDPGMEQKAVITLKKNGKYAIRPSGQPFAYKPAEDDSPSSKPSTELTEKTQAKTAVPATEVRSTTTHTKQRKGESVSMDVDMMGTKVGVSIQVDDDMDGDLTTTSETTETTTTTTMVDAPEPAEEEVVPSCSEMADGDFKDVLASLNSKTFSDSKMTQAKQVLRGNCMSATQIKTVMSSFTYEDDKLEFAKAAYDRCADPENYWKLNDAFDYEMTIDELNEFLESK
ncbi:MAG: DUF4476 domain-containing protein, partial [Cryomorphaceae bacterium]